MATYRGWLEGHDLLMKRDIGVDPGESEEERERSRMALAAVLGQSRCDEGTFERIMGFLGATPSRLVSVACEDMLGVAEQINVPGTSDQYPNWRDRWPVNLDDFGTSARLSRVADIFRREGAHGLSSRSRRLRGPLPPYRAPRLGLADQRERCSQMAPAASSTKEPARCRPSPAACAELQARIERGEGHVAVMAQPVRRRRVETSTI